MTVNFLILANDCIDPFDKTIFRIYVVKCIHQYYNFSQSEHHPLRTIPHPQFTIGPRIIARNDWCVRAGALNQRSCSRESRQHQFHANTDTPPPPPTHAHSAVSSAPHTSEQCPHARTCARRHAHRLCKNRAGGRLTQFPDCPPECSTHIPQPHANPRRIRTSGQPRDE